MAFTQVIPPERVFMEIRVIPLGSDLRKTLKGWGNEWDLMLALIEQGRGQRRRPAKRYRNCPLAEA